MVSAMAPIMPPPAQLITSPQCQTPSVTASKSPRALAATGFSTRASVMSPPPSAQMDKKSESVSPPHSDGIPKMEPFSRPRISRLMKEPPLLQKAEQSLTDRCMALEGDEAYNCWEAVFEFENLKDKYKEECEVADDEDKGSACRPLERFENVVRQSGGVSTLIDNVRMLAYANKKQHDSEKVTPPKAVVKDGIEIVAAPEKHDPEWTSDAKAENLAAQDKMRATKSLYEADGVAKSEEELLLEQEGLMPESPLTRMLRRRGSRDKAL